MSDWVAPKEEDIKMFGKNNLPYPFSVQRVDNVGNGEDLFILYGGDVEIARTTFLEGSQGSMWFAEIARLLNNALMDENDSANLSAYVRLVKEELHYMKHWCSNDSKFRQVYDDERNSEGFKISYNRLIGLIERRSCTPPSKDEEITRLQAERDSLQNEVTMYRDLFKKINELADHITYDTSKGYTAFPGTQLREKKELEVALKRIRDVYVKMAPYIEEKKEENNAKE